jgi:ABC-type transport system involved in multi-copper enzyme maturation permease subunit
MLLLGRTWPGPGETFVLPIALVALLLLTLVGTVPQATLGIARERERRTLEPLLLTRMSPAAILGGELVQVLLTPVLATLALMPLLCLSFWMGSISIARILAVGGVLLLCHLFFAVVSLCASCWCRRSGVALFLGYSAVLLATVGTVLARKLLPGASSPEPGWSDGVLALNPAALLLDVVIPQGGMPVGSEVVPWYVVGAGTYALLSAGFFALGVVGLGRR